MVNYKKYLFFLIFIGFILSLILLFYYCKIKNVYLHPGGGISRIMKGNNLTNTWTNIDDYVTITYIDYIFVILLVLYLCLLIWLRININKNYKNLWNSSLIIPVLTIIYIFIDSSYILE